MRKSKYTVDNICAVIVSYNPDELIISNIRALLPQVGKCVVVDNGSDNREFIKQIKNEWKSVEVIELKENKGIATAINVGVDFCKKHAWSLVLTMDQDTVLGSCAVEALLEPINIGAADSTGINWDNSILENKYVDYLITSGNLTEISTVDSIGRYDEALFIDSVDFDFCLRLKDAGYRLMKVARADAKHNLGEENGLNNYRTHSAFRYYYISRNHFYILRKYNSKHKGFCFKKNVAFISDLIKLTLYDKDRKSKYRAIWRGYKDSKLLI